jgi:hypothetical protein
MPRHKYRLIRRVTPTPVLLMAKLLKVTDDPKAFVQRAVKCVTSERFQRRLKDALKARNHTTTENYAASTLYRVFKEIKQQPTRPTQKANTKRVLAMDKLTLISESTTRKASTKAAGGMDSLNFTPELRTRKAFTKAIVNGLKCTRGRPAKNPPIKRAGGYDSLNFSPRPTQNAFARTAGGIDTLNVTPERLRPTRKAFTIPFEGMDSLNFSPMSTRTAASKAVSLMESSGCASERATRCTRGAPINTTGNMDWLDFSPVKTVIEAATMVVTSESDTPDASDVEHSDLDSSLTWCTLVEALQLESLVSTKGPDLLYKVYRLNNQTTYDAEAVSPTDLASRIKQEFIDVYRGSKCLRSDRFGEWLCYVSQTDDGHLWIQLKSGRSVPSTLDKTKSVVKQTPFFIALIQGNHIALASKGAATKARLVPLFISAIDAVLTKRSGYELVRALSGRRPYRLLEVANGLEQQKAVGRFAEYAAQMSSNPIHTLHEAATGNVLVKSKNRKGTSGILLAQNRFGEIVEHGHDRKRSRNELFGRYKLPCREGVKWVITARTMAFDSVWKSDEMSDFARGNLATGRFKAHFNVQGPNVFQGMRALAELGFFDTKKVPHIIRDAPTLGGAITVVNGSVVMDGMKS